ncbi:MAG: hypothetical protein PWQ09_508 [Candidatus Cloacimonadota bacterium]|jgi:uncharacterized membrane protein|nr:hypothetical protein [Candidatus Cloacimonadota bacterium]
MKKIVVILTLIAILLPLIAATDYEQDLNTKIDKMSVSSEVKVFFISMVPIFELRGAIPIGILRYQLPVWKTYPIAVVGNMIPIFLLLLFYDLITKLFFRVPFLKKILEKLFERTRRKSKLVEKYEELGLMLFVSIPLPVTGAWTGSLAAYIFGLSFWKSIMFILFGVMFAGVLVTILTKMGWFGAALAFIAFSAILINSFIKKRRIQNEKI